MLVTSGSGIASGKLLSLVELLTQAKLLPPVEIGVLTSDGIFCFLAEFITSTRCVGIWWGCYL